MQSEFSRHCVGWSPGRFDFRAYLTLSETRYRIAFSKLSSGRELGRVCDVGGFFGAFPLALARLGYSTSMTETLGYYSHSFLPLFDFLRSEGVRIIDWDPFETPLESSHGQFDTVTLMAVLEHFPHSPARALGNLCKLLAGPDARVLIEVPNLAYWPRRTALLRGKSPLPSITDKWHSAIPFIGHHHEYTAHDLRCLTSLAGLHDCERFSFNYSLANSLWRRLASNPIQTIMTAVLADARECLGVIARQPDGPLHHEGTRGGTRQ